MIEKIIDSVKVTIKGDDNIQDEEIKQYIHYAKEEANKNNKVDNNVIYNIDTLDIVIMDDKVKCTYTTSSIPFDHIRRITGYLSHLTSWNNSKKEEEKERTKHNYNPLLDQIYKELNPKYAMEKRPPDYVTKSSKEENLSKAI